MSHEADGDPESPVALEIEDALDLHAFAPRDIPRVVRAYLDEVCQRGFPEVRLIHGKGKGVQRDRVRRVLADHPGVVEFFDGTPGRGGWGATIVRLAARGSATPKARPPPGDGGTSGDA